MNKNIYVIIGIPGSGKSTWVEEHNSSPELSSVINMDSIRVEVAGDPTDQTKNALVASLARQRFLSAISIGVPTIYWDNTTTQRKYRKELIQMGHKGGYEVNAVYFKIPFETCLKRNANRSRVVPVDVLVRMANQIQPPTNDEGWDNIITVEA